MQANKATNYLSHAWYVLTPSIYMIRLVTCVSTTMHAINDLITSTQADYSSSCTGNTIFVQETLQIIIYIESII